ncbi:hypothetical protein BKA70DRAFT_1430404 [Coprinopsis sp. MPI-PUGE-AT-0042]|nr:hypothetical protein BKA70DRAFT_1430404 [Coprinopsis sp. MPI-PUGE-AT-0042]
MKCTDEDRLDASTLPTSGTPQTRVTTTAFTYSLRQRFRKDPTLLAGSQAGWASQGSCGRKDTQDHTKSSGKNCAGGRRMNFRATSRKGPTMDLLKSGKKATSAEKVCWLCTSTSSPGGARERVIGLEPGWLSLWPPESCLGCLYTRHYASPNVRRVGGQGGEIWSLETFKGQDLAGKRWHDGTNIPCPIVAWMRCTLSMDATIPGETRDGEGMVNSWSTRLKLGLDVPNGCILDQVEWLA